MKLKELKEVIYSDLIIIDHNTNHCYEDVWKDGEIFAKYSDYEVIGIRSVTNSNGTIDYIQISVK